jgi:glycosyltransferase involved in cell wall biosynthesis
MDSFASPFTVLTPTFNRAATLPRLYRSLCRQSYRNFEWLVVDDGSSDDTREIIAGWESQSPFPIRYVSQFNAGKHVAFNHGVREARGELIAQIDSDDELLPEALDKLLRAWKGIPPGERSAFFGVTGLCVDDANRIVGDLFPQDRFVSDSLEARYRYHIHGEKWGFQPASILREFPFPEPAGVKNLPMDIVWSRAACKYKILFINEPLRIYHSDVPGGQLTTEHMQVRKAAGIYLYYKDILNIQLRWFMMAPLQFLRSSAQYTRAALHIKKSFVSQVRSLSPAARILWVLAGPVGVFMYWKDTRLHKWTGKS